MRMRRNNWGAYASLLGLTGGCLTLTTACSDQPFDLSEEIESRSDGVIIGNPDFVRVTPDGSSVPAKYRPYVNAFGKLKLGSGSCSATHVGNGIAISAGHCWSATATRKAASCTGSSVDWGYTTGGTASTSTCTNILAMQQTDGTNKLDYAIFTVSPIPPVAIPVDFSAKAPSGAALTIFSHPAGRTLEWSNTCTTQSPSATQFSYQCDTEPGSSGATVLNDTALKVAGIHWGGGGNANYATHILSTPIREFLQPPDGGGTGGAGGADGGDAGGKAGAAGSGGASDAGDAATGDGATDGSSDAPRDGTVVDGAAGAAGMAGSAGASGAAGAAGAGGAGGTAGTGGAAGKAGSGGTGGTGGAGGKAGGAGTGGSTGGAGGAAGSAGTGGSGATAGTGGGTAGASGKGGTGGTGGTGGSSAGTGGTAASDDGGCSCRIGASSSRSGDRPASGVMAAFAMGVVASLRRRARRKSTSQT